MRLRRSGRHCRQSGESGASDMSYDVDADLMAARRLAATLNDRQKGLLIAIASRKDASRLLAEVARESERWLGFGSDHLEPSEVMLLAAVEHALSRHGLEGPRLARRIAAEWDDVSTDVRERLQERVNVALEAEEPGTQLDAAPWREITTLPVLIYPPGM